MFTCPEKDIHSIYLDNELPAAYIKEYEAHIQSCEKCRKELERLKKLRSLFQADSNKLEFSKDEREHGFERLQARLSFKKVVDFSNEKRQFSYKFIKPILPAAAAAAIFAVIIPLRIQKFNEPEQDGTLTPIVAKQIQSPVSENNVVIDGNIPREFPVRMFNGNSQNVENVAYTQYNGVASTEKKQVQQMSEALAAVDILKPEFGESNTIQIRITIPTAVTIPVHLYNNSSQSGQ